MSPELLVGVLAIGVALFSIGLTVLVKGRRGGWIVTILGSVITLSVLGLLYKALKYPPAPAPVVVHPTPSLTDWGAVLMKGDPVIVEIDDASAVPGGAGNSIEHRQYRLSFNRERCEWTIVGPMTYQQYGLVENHKRVYGPFIVKPLMGREEVRTGGDCVLPTSERINFVGVPLKFDPNGTLNGQVPNPGPYGSLTVPKRAGHLSLPPSS